MSLDQALAVVKAAGYRVTAPRVRNPVRVAQLNAIGRPYSPSYDPNYKMKYRPKRYAYP